jgi:hypothetical protein
MRSREERNHCRNCAIHLGIATQGPPQGQAAKHQLHKKTTQDKTLTIELN